MEARSQLRHRPAFCANRRSSLSPMLPSWRNPPLCFSLALVAATSWAQTTASEPQTAPPPVAYSSVSELNAILSQLKQTSQNMQTDLGKMRIEKWKTDNSNKRQTQANVDSIQRNLQSALPEI